MKAYKTSEALNTDNYNLVDQLTKLGIDENNIYNILIRKNTSPLVQSLLNQIDISKDNIQNIILNLFFKADQMKPITCNKETLSALTGLSQRQIDERRRAKQISSIQLTGQSGAGRKIILFNPDDLKKEILNPVYKINKIGA